jgi:hypothetical protein
MSRGCARGDLKDAIGELDGVVPGHDAFMLISKGLAAHLCAAAS